MSSSGGGGGACGSVSIDMEMHVCVKRPHTCEHLGSDMRGQSTQQEVCSFFVEVG